MKLGVDLDGTVADNLDLLVEAMNKYCSKNLCGQEIHQYNLCKTYNISEKDFISLMVTEEPNIIKKSPLIPFAKEKLLRLYQDGWQIHIITARNPGYREITEQWLGQMGVPYHELHLLNSHDKLAICQQLKVEFMVEDNVHNAYNLSEGGIEVLLYDAPHNRHWSWEGIRCKNWHEVYNSITKECK